MECSFNWTECSYTESLGYWSSACTSRYSLGSLSQVEGYLAVFLLSVIDWFIASVSGKSRFFGRHLARKVTSHVLRRVRHVEGLFNLVARYVIVRP